jgi:hypothetical protein
MSEAGETTYQWTANDWSNIVTISSAALASVLLVLFKSRCSKISLCWGLWSCDRVVQEESDNEQDGQDDQRADRNDQQRPAQPELIP